MVELASVPSPPEKSTDLESVSPDLEVLHTLGADKPSPWRRRGAWIGGGLLLLGVAGFFVLQANKADPTARFEITEVEEGDLTIEVTATGALEPVNQVDVGAEASGRIKEVLVDFNDEVKKGQLLARLDTEVVELQVKQAQAQSSTARAAVRQAEAALADAERSLERTQAMHARRLVSDAELETAQSARNRAAPAVDVAKAQLRTAWASQEMTQANLRRSEVFSPIDGTVIARLVEPGQVVVSTLQAAVLFRLAEDLKQMRLTADIDEADIGRIRAGQVATFTVAAYPGRTFEARLTDVHNAPKAFQQIVTYEALFDVDNAEQLLRPGMTATVRVTTATFEDALTVPNAALRFVPASERRADGTTPLRPKGAQVWVEGEAGEAEAIDVATRGTDGVRSIIEGDSIEEGLEVIVSERAIPVKGAP